MGDGGELVSSGTENLSWEQWRQKYLMNRWTFLVIGLLVGFVATALGSEKFGSPLKPFASTTTLLIGVILVDVLAGAAMSHFASWTLLLPMLLLLALVALDRATSAGVGMS